MNDQLQSFLDGRRDDRFDAIFSQPVDGVVNLEVFTKLASSDQNLHFITPG